MTTPVMLLMAVAAMMVVRFGWDGRRGVALAGWLIAAVAAIGATVADGAWGLAVTILAGSAAALAMLLYAGWTSPARPQRPARVAAAIALPQRASEITARVSVFVLVVPVAFVAAQWLAFGVQAAARRAGAVETDAVVITLFLQPIAWAIIIAVQMTRAGPSRMIAAPASAAILGTVFWSVG